MTTYPTTQRVKTLTGSRKKQFFLRPQETIRPTGGWSGGSRSCFNGINYKTGTPIPLEVGDHFSKASIDQEIPCDCIVIETGFFCGKPAFPAIYCRPEETESVKIFLGII